MSESPIEKSEKKTGSVNFNDLKTPQEAEIEQFMEEEFDSINRNPQLLREKITKLCGVDELPVPQKLASQVSTDKVKNYLTGNLSIIGGGKGHVSQVTHPDRLLATRVLVLERESGELFEYRMLSGECTVAGLRDEYGMDVGPIAELNEEQFAIFSSIMWGISSWNGEQLEKMVQQAS
ncbi:hypothetical protein ACFL0F_01635 [Patescibacteria group bacterium]